MRIKHFLEMVTSANINQPPLPQRLSLINRLKCKKKKKKKLEESLVLMRFKYDNYKNDPRPRVLVLDPEYPGKEGQKSYGKRKDFLGWNINYYSNPQDAIKTINDIDTFARMLSANNEEKYERMKKFFPEQYNLIRRYQTAFIKRPKAKLGRFWRPINIHNIKDINKEMF